MAEVLISDKLVGDGHPCYIVAEIGINHNGDINLVKRLIDLAVEANCDAVKFQKRTVDVVYTPDELMAPRESPFGTTNGDLKRGLEFGLEEYREIDRHCKHRGVPWFASCWDEQSVDFVEDFNPPCHKIASASITDDALLRYIKSMGRPMIMSTGLSNVEEVDHAVEVLGKENLIILHCCGTYPADYQDLNLSLIPCLRRRYGVLTGYSGHETGIAPSVATVALGACVVERHITLDRAMWGSDQAASLGPSGLIQLVRDIRLIEMSMGDGIKRLLPNEVPVMKKLRRVGGWSDVR